MKTNIVDFYTRDEMSQEDAELVILDSGEAVCVMFGNGERNYNADELLANHARTLSFSGYKMIHIDDMIDQCETVDEVRVLKRIFDTLECELIHE